MILEFLWNAFMWFWTEFLFNLMSMFTFCYLLIFGMFIAVLLRKGGWSIRDSFGLSVWYLQLLIHPNGFIWHFCYWPKWDPQNVFSDPILMSIGVGMILLGVFYLRKYEVWQHLTWDKWVLFLYVITIIYHIWWLDIWAESIYDCSWQTAAILGPAQSWRVFPVNHLGPKFIQTLVFLLVWRKPLLYGWSNLKPEKIPSNLSILDVGCGNQARGTVNIDKIVPDDVWERHATTCNARNISNFVKADCEHLPFNDRSFQKVVCHHTIEHLKNPFKALREMKRVASKTVIVVWPNHFLEVLHAHLFCRSKLEWLRKHHTKNLSYLKEVFETKGKISKPSIWEYKLTIERGRDYV